MGVVFILCVFAISWLVELQTDAQTCAAGGAVTIVADTMWKDCYFSGELITPANISLSAANVTFGPAARISCLGACTLFNCTVQAPDIAFDGFIYTYNTATFINITRCIFTGFASAVLLGDFSSGADKNLIAFNLYVHDNLYNTACPKQGLVGWVYGCALVSSSGEVFMMGNISLRNNRGVNMGVAGASVPVLYIQQLGSANNFGSIEVIGNTNEGGGGALVGIGFEMSSVNYAGYSWNGSIIIANNTVTGHLFMWAAIHLGFYVTASSMPFDIAITNNSFVILSSDKGPDGNMLEIAWLSNYSGSIIISNNSFTMAVNTSAYSSPNNLQVISMKVAPNQTFFGKARIADNIIVVNPHNISKYVRFVTFWGTTVAACASWVVSGNTVRFGGGSFGQFVRIDPTYPLAVESGSSLILDGNVVDLGNALDGISSIFLVISGTWASRPGSTVRLAYNNVVGVNFVIDTIAVGSDMQLLHNVFSELLSEEMFAGDPTGVGKVVHDCSNAFRTSKWTPEPNLNYSLCTATNTVSLSHSVTVSVPPSNTLTAIAPTPDAGAAPIPVPGGVVFGLGGVSVVGGVVSIGSSSGFQIAAVFSVMACKTVQSTALGSFLNPFQISSSHAADLIGSVALLAGAETAYFGVAGMVLFARSVVKINTASSVKKVLLYPQAPLAILMLLLPGITYDGGTLLYGISDPLWWERSLGGVAVFVSLALTGEHIRLTIVAHREQIAKTALVAVQRPGAACKNPMNIQTADMVEMIPADRPLPLDASCLSLDENSITSWATAIPTHTSTPLMRSPLTPQPPTQVDEVASDSSGGSSGESDVSVLLDEPWYLLYTPHQRTAVPFPIRELLMAQGYWTSRVEHTRFTVVAAFRPQLVVWLGSHNTIRILTINLIAAINPGSAAGCAAVQAILALLCFAHGAMLVFTVPYRIPVLNAVRGLQSMLLGVMACGVFIDNVTSQAALLVLIMCFAVFNTLVAYVVTFLEHRVASAVIPGA